MEELCMKVCFFSPTAYGYFNPESYIWAGGAETQQVLIAKHMVDRGIEVSFIVGDHGQPDIEIHEGITVIKSFTPFAGNRKLRFIPDMLRIRRAMRIADADIYNQRAVSFYTGQFSWFVSRMGKKFTFSLGIDYNCFPDCGGNLSFPMTALYRYGIKNTDAIIAQTEKQKGLLMKQMGRESVLIRNGIGLIDADRIPEYPSESREVASCAPSQESHRKEFLWVGSFRRRKRPELFLELAQQIPEADFTIVGGGGDDSSYYRGIAEKATSIPNVNYPGFVQPEKIEKYYKRAYAYINTSNLEGFPNTYLHSWRRGVPTFTIEIDPDEIIERNGIGGCTGTFDRLVETIRSIVSDTGRRNIMSRRALDYISANHDIRDKGDEYIRLFESLV